MEWHLTFVALLHVLVLAYWLGADLGAFYASGIVVDDKASPASRLTAAKVLANLDMAPRTALILALPTGVSLGRAKGWFELDVTWVLALWAAAAVWLILAWAIHLKHLSPKHPVRRLDLLIRWVVLAGLAITGVGGLAGAVDLPLFVILKLLILAAAIALGLMIRVALGPFGPAFAEVATGSPSAEANAAIRASLAKAKPAVIGLWVLLLTAAFLGLGTPA